MKQNSYLHYYQNPELLQNDFFLEKNHFSF